MKINKLILTNFRNYEKLNLEFNENINIIYGDNAQGKTNIVEAVYYTSFGKSFRNRRDSEVVKFDKDYFNISIEYEKNHRSNDITVFYDRLKNNKRVLINGVTQKKLSSLYGKINIVIFKPEDINLIKDGPEKRRKFLNRLIGSISSEYINAVAKYYNILEQKNSTLKKYLEQVKNGKNIDELDFNLIEVLNEQLYNENIVIYNYRKRYIEKLNLFIKLIHEKYIINKEKEELKIEYNSKLDNPEKFKKDMKRNLKREIFLGYSSSGIHKDDMSIYLNGKEIQKYGSQGQQKSAILSLKIAEMEILKDEFKEEPILILDDFMSELDDKRINKFFSNIKDTQIIITTTKKIDIEELIKNRENEKVNVKYIKIKNGKSTEE